jgi:hypothetical protein
MKKGRGKKVNYNIIIETNKKGNLKLVFKFLAANRSQVPSTQPTTYSLHTTDSVPNNK